MSDFLHDQEHSSGQEALQSQGKTTGVSRPTVRYESMGPGKIRIKVNQIGATRELTAFIFGESQIKLVQAIHKRMTNGDPPNKVMQTDARTSHR